MNQKEFSKYIFEYLSKDFPEFIPSVNYKNDDSFDCELKNPTGEFAIWIATYSCEITFGLEAPDGKTDIHTHISCYEKDDIEYCCSRLKDMIEEIKSNKVVVYKNTSNVYDWIENEKLAEKENKDGVTFKKALWN